MHPIRSLPWLVCILVASLLIVGDGSAVNAQSATDLAALNRQISDLRRAGKFDEATPLAEMSLRLTRAHKGEEHPDTAIRVAWLALLYRAQGRTAEAEPLYRRSLAMFEKALGPEHPHVGTALGNLAGLYRDQGRYAEAEPLYRRGLALDEKALGPDHNHVGASLGNLAHLYELQGRYAEAEPLYLRNLAIYEKSLGPEHPLVGVALNNLAESYRAQRRYGDAEPLYRRNLALTEKALGPEHPDVGVALNNLATLYRDQGRYREAEPLYRRSLAVVEKALGQEHLQVGTLLNNLAWLALAQNDLAGAAERWRAATSLLQRRADRGLGGASDGTSKGEAQRSGWQFAGLLKTTHRLQRSDPQGLTSATQMFETAQWGRASEAATSLAQMAARSAGGSPGLAALVRERQDLVSEWQATDKLLIAARSERPAERKAAGEKKLSGRLNAIDARLAAIDVRLARDFPDYAALAGAKPIAVADVQSSLRDNEALLLFLDTDASFKPLPEETFAWILTNKDVRWLRSELGTTALTREVAALRCGLDSTAWDGEGGKRCAGLLKLPPDRLPKEGQPLPFDVGRAHALYKGLLGEAEDVIRGKHLLIVPSGALTTLPFQVLVTKPPPASNDLASASWLIREHALTVLPSVASLAALRRTGKPSAAPKPMIGFGNPLLDGNQAHPKHGAYFKQQAAVARAQTGCAPSDKTRTASLRVVSRALDTAPLANGRVADLGHLRIQTPLPETADELCAVARSVGGSPEDVRIGGRATEAEVKRMSSSGELAKYRILHFATHGTLAGQLKGTSEPGLILSPPKTATAEDDGFLSGSEIASLKLDADWVILSACNTAGGAGEGEAAEALSGLARVVFYAGARALLVSHWEVDSDAAVKLVTGAIGALAKDKSIGRAEAMRQAMLAAMADTTRPANWTPAWHPAVWAPFVVVGEGGAGR